MGNVEKAIVQFKEKQEEMKTSLEMLREMVKKVGSLYIQEKIAHENFEEASRVLKLLDTFSQIEFTSNAEEILSFAKTIEQMEGDHPIQSDDPTVQKLSEKEWVLLEEMGLTGLARKKDATQDLANETLFSLEKKGYITIERIPFFVFEMTVKGAEYYQEKTNITPNESLKVELEKRNPSLKEAFMMYDVENALPSKGYKIIKISEQQVEVEKEETYYYLTIDYGLFRENDYFSILDKINPFKNIGFICLDERTKERAIQASMDWVKKNPKKISLLSIHATDLSTLEKEGEVFESIINGSNTTV